MLDQKIRSTCYVFRTLHADVPTLSLLTAYNSKICRICVIRVPMKILYKTEFLHKSSWKVESAQLENFYFPVGKLFFLSWKVKISQ